MGKPRLIRPVPELNLEHVEAGVGKRPGNIIQVVENHKMRLFFRAAAACLLALSAPVVAVAPSDSLRTSPPGGPVVAVIDSGIARTRELAPLLVDERDLGQVSPREPFQPRYDHGTMVATILARALDNQVRLVSLRIDDPAGCPAGRTPPCQPSAQPIAAAIRAATAMHVDAINISMRLAEAPAIVAAVHEATQQGILVVMAAGNEGEDRPGNLAMARAGFPHAVLVGALDAKGLPWPGTNRPLAGETDYTYSWERGVNVPTMLIDGSATTATGTSFAAPLETARRLAQRAVSRGAALASSAGVHR